MTGFLDYKNSPFVHYLLPIIPREVPLSDKSGLTPERIGKIPGRWTPGGWVGFGDFTKHTTTEAQLDTFASYFTHDQGVKETIGMLGADFPMLDSDVEDEEAAQIVRQVVAMFFGETATRVRPNSNKFLMVLRRIKGSPFITKRRMTFQHPMLDTVEAVELAGKGQQALIEGRHPSGVDYAWEGKSLLETGADNLPEVDNVLIDAFFEVLKSELAGRGYIIDPKKDRAGLAAGGATGLSQTTAERTAIGPDHPDRVDDLGLLADLLKACPCDAPAFADRDDWIKMLMAIKAACGGDDQFYEAYVWPWCSAYEGNDEDYVRERWASIHDSGLGWSYCLAVAQGFDWKGIASLFGTIDEAALADDDAAYAGVRPASQSLTPDESVIADQFVKGHAKKDWIVVPIAGERVKWYRLENGIWVNDDLSIRSETSQLCQRVARVLRSGQPTQKDLARAQALCSASLARNVATLVRSDDRMQVPLKELDRHPWLLAFPGGYVDKGCVIHKPSPDLFFTKSLRFKPDFDAQCPQFDAHLLYMANGDLQEVEAILRWLGYCLSGTGQEQKFMFWKGAGGSGISTLLECVGLCAGGYAKVVDHKAFMVGASERFGPATLSRGWYIFTSEIDQNGQFSDTTMKTATGSGSMEIEEKNRDHRDIQVNFGINMQGNRVPSFTRVDAALKRRLILAEFDQVRGKDGLAVQKRFAQRMAEAEGPAILARILKARQRYDKEGLIIMPRWQQAADAYFASIDVKGLFITEELTFKPEAVLPTKKLYEAFELWHHDAGYKTHSGSINAFIRELKEHPLIRENGVVFKRQWINGKFPHVAVGLNLIGTAFGQDFTKIEEAFSGK